MTSIARPHASRNTVYARPTRCLGRCLRRPAGEQTTPEANANQHPASSMVRPTGKIGKGTALPPENRCSAASHHSAHHHPCLHRCSGPSQVSGTTEGYRLAQPRHVRDTTRNLILAPIAECTYGHIRLRCLPCPPVLGTASSCLVARVTVVINLTIPLSVQVQSHTFSSVRAGSFSCVSVRRGGSCPVTKAGRMYFVYNHQQPQLPGICGQHLGISRSRLFRSPTSLYLLTCHYTCLV